MVNSLNIALEKSGLSQTRQRAARLVVEKLQIDFIEAAFRSKNVRQGWQLTGISPYSPRQLLSNVRGGEQDTAGHEATKKAIPKIEELAK